MYYICSILGMDKCLKQVTDRYGTGCTFIILSNNPERIEVAVKVQCTYTMSNAIMMITCRTIITLAGHCLMYQICAVYRQCSNWAIYNSVTVYITCTPTSVYYIPYFYIHEMNCSVTMVTMVYNCLAKPYTSD